MTKNLIETLGNGEPYWTCLAGWLAGCLVFFHFLGPGPMGPIPPIRAWVPWGPRGPRGPNLKNPKRKVEGISGTWRIQFKKRPLHIGCQVENLSNGMVK